MSTRRKAEGGFSLVEMLAALAVVSLSLSMLYQASAGTVRNVRVDQHYSYAVLQAQSLLALHPRVTISGINEQGYLAGYHWRVVSYPLDTIQDVPGPGLQQLDVEVSWGEGSQKRRVTLTTVVPEVDEHEL